MLGMHVKIVERIRGGMFFISRSSSNYENLIFFFHFVHGQLLSVTIFPLYQKKKEENLMLHAIKFDLFNSRSI